MNSPVDAPSRETITRDLDTSMLVEAGAGSGKTTSLVARMLALIAAGKCRVENMVAVTFTRKAAAELRGRFQIALEKAAHVEKTETLRQRYLDSLLNLDLFFAGTIHSFCARLLRERPVESGIDPDFIELEEDENVLLRARCWAEYIDGLHVSGSELLNTLSRLGINPSDLSSVYDSVSLYAEVGAVCERLDKPDFSQERLSFNEYIRQASAALPTYVPEKDWDGLQSVIRRAQRLSRHLDLSNDKNFVLVLEALSGSPPLTQNRWKDPSTAKEQASTHAQFRDDVVIPALDKWRRYCHFFIMDLVIPGVEYFAGVRQKNSWMNYQDLLVKSAELLRNNEEVRRYFQKSFTHILVDEFQDTDPIQAEVIIYLSGDNPSETSWRNVKVRPGGLFVVGDPKQSIYRFRRADIDTYNEVKEIICNSGGSVIPLTVNFRSVPALCNWINPIFGVKFPEGADRFQAAFEKLEPYSNSEHGGVRCITISKQKSNRQADVASRDAQRITSWIEWALKGNLAMIGENNTHRVARPEDFMILLRYTKYISLYARELETRGIPYEVAGGAGFGKSEEVGHFLTLLSCVAEPDDRISLIGALRGPLYGVSDDLLYRFKSAGGNFSYLTPQEQCSDEEARIQVGGILSDFAEFHRWSRAMSAPSALSRIVDRLGIIPLAVAMEMGETRAGNLLKVIELAEAICAKGSSSFSDVVKGIRQYYEEIDTEEMSAEPGRKNVVRVMNLHKAKGLEAAVVFLADPLKDAVHGPKVHIDRLADKAVGYFLATIPSGNWGTESEIGVPPHWEVKKVLEEKYSKAEEDRLLYVATTRAKQLLVVSRYPSVTDKGAWKELEPYVTTAQELEDVELPIGARDRIVVTKAQLEKARNQRDELFTRCRVPSYTYESVTDIVSAEAESSPFIDNDGTGRKWGSAVHRALELMIKYPSYDLDNVSQAVLSQEGLPFDKQKEMTTALKTVASSDFWQRINGSPMCFAEVPFALKVQGMPIHVVSGKIDLVFRENDGWVIVDYKSDSGEENMDELVAYYSRQISMYREYWEKITGEAVKEAGIFFTNIDRWIVI